MQIHSLLNYKAIGLAFYESKRENSFDRFPFIFKDKVRKEVWNLSKNNSGISIEFLTDSSFIEFEWEVINNFTMNHMPNTGIKGLDLYTKSNNEWIYVGTGIPEGKKNFCRIIQNMELKNLNILGSEKEFNEHILIKVRSTGKLLKAKVNIKNKSANVNIIDGEAGISPGQACVFYSKDDAGDKLLGGGWIFKTVNKNLST